MRAMTPEKLRLLKNLDEEVFATIGNSEIHGIGVVAIRDIPKGTNPFAVPYRPGFPEKIVDLTEEEVDLMPKEVQERIRSFFVKSNGTYPVLWSGLNGMNVSFYMNHSDEPNIEANYDFGVAGAGRVKIGMVFTPFLSNRDISKGEELTWDYRTDENADDIHKQFPFIKKDGFLKKAWNRLSK